MEKDTSEKGELKRGSSEKHKIVRDISEKENPTKNNNSYLNKDISQKNENGSCETEKAEQGPV